MTKIVDFPIKALPSGIDPQQCSTRDLVQTLMLEKAQTMNNIASGKTKLTPQLEATLKRTDELLAKLGYQT